MDCDYAPRVMVFVEERRLAEMISDWLKSEDDAVYKVSKFISSQTSAGSDSEWQKLVLN